MTRPLAPGRSLSQMAFVVPREDRQVETVGDRRSARAAWFVCGKRTANVEGTHGVRRGAGKTFTADDRQPLKNGISSGPCPSRRLVPASTASPLSRAAGSPSGAARCHTHREPSLAEGFTLTAVSSHAAKPGYVEGAKLCGRELREEAGRGNRDLRMIP